VLAFFLHAKLSSAGGEFYDHDAGAVRGLRFGGRTLGACFARAGGGSKKMDDV
jgi:hypothetical protein